MTMTTTKTVTTKTGGRAPRPLNPQTRLAQQAGQNWAMMSVSERASWGILAAQLNQATTMGLPGRKVGYSTYFAHLCACTAMNVAPPTTAPTKSGVPALTGLFVITNYIAGVFSLKLFTDTGYDGPVVVYATPPLLPNRRIYVSTPRIRLASFPSLPETAAFVDVTAEYLAVYYPPEVGYQIALEVLPMSATGFRGVPVTVSSVITSSPDSEFAPADAPFEQDKAA